MKPKLTVGFTAMVEDVGRDEYANEVRVTDEERPWLDISLGVQSWTDADIVFFRLASVHIISDNLSESKPTLVLADGEWWAEVLDAVLEHIAFNSIEFDRAAERHDGEFNYAYGWEDGEVKDAEIRPAEPLAP